MGFYELSTISVSSIMVFPSYISYGSKPSISCTHSDCQPRDGATSHFEKKHDAVDFFSKCLGQNLPFVILNQKL